MKLNAQRTAVTEAMAASWAAQIVNPWLTEGESTPHRRIWMSKTSAEYENGTAEHTVR